MTGSRRGNRHVFPWAQALACALFAVSGPLVAQVDHFTYVTTYGADLYQVGQSVTFRVEARNASEGIETSYNGSVSIGLYEPVVITNLGDPRAEIGPMPVGSSPQTAVASLAFSSGVLEFYVTFRSACVGEKVWLKAAAGGVPDLSWPDHGNVFSNYQVTGHRERFFTQDATGDAVPAVYPPDPDGLTGTAQTGSDLIVPVPIGQENALVYTFSGLGGGSALYPDDNAAVSTRLWVRKSGSGDPYLFYRVIVDYDGDLADYRNPEAEDGVWQKSTHNIDEIQTIPSVLLTQAAFSGAYTPPVGAVDNARVILLVWGESVDPTAFLRVRGADEANSSSVWIPYSLDNAQEVSGELIPTQVLSNSPVTVRLVIKNFSSKNLRTTNIRIPANVDPGLNVWSFGDVPTCDCAGVVPVNPVDNTTDGYLNIDWTGSEIAPNASAEVTMVFNPSAQDEGVFDFEFTDILDDTASAVAYKTNVNLIETMGAPAASSGVTVEPVNQDDGGGRVALTWGEVTNNQANGYNVYRSDGGGPWSPVTVLDGFSATSWTDPAAPNLTSLVYQVRARNNVTESVGTDSSPVTAYADPATITGLSARTHDGAVSLAWSAPVSVPGSYAVAGYEIYRATSSNGQGPVTLGGTAGTLYDDTTATNAGVTYYYKVRAVDDQHTGVLSVGEHESEWSAEVQGFPPGYPPRNLAGSLLPAGAAQTIRLNWTAPLAWNVSSPVSYRIYRHENGAPVVPGDLLAEVDGTTTSYDDEDSFTPGTNIRYRVLAMLDDGSYFGTNLSNTVTVFIVPTSPLNAAASPGTAAVTFTWDELGGQEVDEYRVETVNLTTSAAATVSTAMAVTYVHSGLTQGVNYTYRVSAHNSGGWGEWSALVTSALTPPIPAGLAALSGSGQAVTLSWSAAPYANITGYNVYRDSDAGFAGAVPVTVGATGLSHVDATVSAGATYFYFLQYQNSGGSGPPTGAVSLMVPPDTPTGLSAAPGASGNVLNWDAVAGQGVTAYHVYSSATDPDPFTAGTRAQTVTGTTWTDTQSAGTFRYYMVTSVNGGANLPGGESAPTGAVSQRTLPDVPSNLAVTYTTSGTQNDWLRLDWSAITGQGVAEYHVYRDGAPLSSTAAVGYIDTSTAGNHGTVYAYRIQADNFDGVTGGPGNTTTAVSRMVPPSAPLGTGADIASGSVSLYWSAVAGQGVTQYRVYRSVNDPDPYKNGAGIVAYQGPNVYFNDAAAPGDMVYYRVAAVNGQAGVPGGESVPSLPAIQMAPPDAPTALAVTCTGANRDQALLTWTAPSGTVTDNHVYRGGVSILSAGAVTTTTDTGTLAQYGVTFTYQVQADNFDGTIGGASALTTPVTFIVPPRPISATASGVLASNDTAVTVAWAPELAQGVTGYRIYRQLDGGPFYLVATVSGAGVNTTTVLGNGMRGHTYGFRVHAVNAGGEGAAANVVSTVIPPSVPTGLAAQSGFAGASARVDASWEANPLTQPVTGYVLYRSGTEVSPIGNYSAVATVGGGTFSHSDTPLTDAAVYHYLLSAAAGGVESRLNTVNAVAVTAYRPPDAPGSLSASPGNGAVTLTWSASGVQTSYPIAGYLIYVSTTAGVLGTPYETIPYNGTSRTLLGLANGTTYYFQVKAQDDRGHLGAASTEVFEMPVVKPGPPDLYAAESGRQEILLRWNPGTPGTLPTEWYVIYRCDSSGGPCTPVPVTVLDSSQTAYNDNDGGGAGLTQSSYDYQVQAVDSSGLTLVPQHVSALSGTLTGSLVLPVDLNPPQNVHANAWNAAVTLSWVEAYDPGAVVTGYTIHRSVSGGAYQPVTNFPNGSIAWYEDVAVVNGTNYSYYMVSNSSVAGISSNSSATVTARPAGPPISPALVRVDGNVSATLTWTHPGTVDGVPVTQYLITRDAAPLTVLKYPSASFVDPGLANGATYVYTLTAYNQNMTPGSPSAPVSAFPYVLGPPISLSTSITIVGNRRVRVDFEEPTPGTFSFPVTGYAAYAYPTSQPPPAVPSTIAIGTVRTFVDGSASNEEVRFFIRAIDDKGHYGSASVTVWDRATLPPDAPATLRVHEGDGQNLLDWPDSVPGTLPVSYYVVYRDGSAAATVAGDRSWYLDIAANGIAHEYSVTAYDPFLRPDPVGHMSGASVTLTGTADFSNVNPPTALTAVSAGENSIRLTWEPANDGGRPVTAVRVYRNATEFPASYGAPVTTITFPLGSPITTIEDTGLSAGVTYHYVVTSYDASSLLESAPSNEATAATLPQTRIMPNVISGDMLLDHNIVRPLTGQKLGIFFQLASPAEVEIRIYNVAGDLMNKIDVGPSPAGQRLFVDWNVRDRLNSIVASGIYLIEIKAGPLHVIGKVAVLK